MKISDDDIERIVSAAETIEESLSVLAAKQSLSRESYRADRETRDVVERRFVKVTEATLDIARTLVVHERGSPPKSNPATMLALDEVGVLNRTTTKEMVQAARFRNVLAHTYGDAIDHDDVYAALQSLERYRDFLHDVRAYLDDTGAL
ncbi:DUF86 family protein [Natronomonas moolapensis 8.8.11]|uniref:DUF86 family protein n=1 Tax=Natronomonas moolapensis (strain DSM 18674 / CECT 7526 / JCM 14361 / 8.8.11) TaxID=268739 RepID=M1XL01_NATM8|nr:DUF86 domain-containing protein [Natronomonas moolapensis]CCQ36827.1 DUF86 family protein [Natronomonas moolapensis 8.8.11]